MKRFLIAVNLSKTKGDIYEFNTKEERLNFINELHKFGNINYALSEIKG